MSEKVTGTYSLHARELLGYDKAAIWNLPVGVYHITFDDGEVIVTTSRRTIFSWYMWFLHRMYPNVPLLARHHIQDVQMTRSLYRTIVSRCLYSTRKTLNIEDKTVLEGLWRTIYEQFNDVYNDMIERLEAYVTTITAIDIANLRIYQPIKREHDALKQMRAPSAEMVADTTDKIERILRTHREIAANPLVRALKCGTSRSGQVLQIVGPIGHRTDVDGTMKEPAITRSYGDGMITMREILVESRDACRNIFFQNRPMQISEWNNRVVQLMASDLANIHPGDCGTTDYINVTIADRKVLEDISGMYMWDESISVVRPVMSDEYSLIGKVVQLRCITECRYPDRSGFCATCYGELYYNIPADTNIGHVAATVILGPVGQLILSQKHYNGAAKSIKFDLDEYADKFVEIVNDGDGVKLRDDFIGKRFTISFKAKEVRDMLDLELGDDEEEEDIMDGAAVCALSLIKITYDNGLGIETVVIHLSKARQLPVFSMDFIKHIRISGFNINATGDYEVNMDDWDVSKTLLDMPLAQFSAPMYMTLIQEFIRGSTIKGDKTQNSTVLDYSNLGDALIAFRSITALKLNFSFTQLAVVLQATKIASAADRDYRSPLIKSEGQPRRFNEIMRYRSVIKAYAYQQHKHTFFDPMSFLITKRPPHNLDAIMREY